MKVLFIHTYYKEKGGEDIVFETEKNKLQLEGVTVESLIFNNSRYSFLKIIFQHFNLVSYFLVIKKIKIFKPDLIHIHNLHFAASPSVIWAASSRRVPIVMTLHNYRLICPSAILYHHGELFLDSLESGFPWKAVRNRVYKNSALLSFWLASSMRLHKALGTWKKVAKFILLTEFSKAVYLKSDIGLLKEQIIIKPNFINSSWDKVPFKKTDFVYVGRLTKEKGIDTILHAFEKLPFNLTIIGDGALRKDIEAFSRSNKNVRYLGFQDNHVVQEVLRSSSALLFTSKSFEGMPLTVLESFANGTPVIAASLGSIPSIVTDNYNGLLFEPGDSFDLAAKIQHWNSMQEEAKNVYYMNAYETFKRKFTSESNIKQMLSIYNQLISKK